MKFGVFYVLECPDRDYRRAYQEMLDQIEYAENLGFDSVWLAEHHGDDYGSMPSPQVAAAAVAERTRTMRIGMAVSILPFDNPIRTAEDYAMVDVISGGRLDFGAGRGYQPQEFRMLGVRQDISRELFAEAIDIIQGSWTQDPFTYQGKHYKCDRISIRPAVLQKPHPPIYVAAISPETFDLVARRGFQLTVTPTLMSLDELKEFILKAKAELMRRGRDPLKLDFPMNWQMHIAESVEQAKINTKEAFDWYFKRVMELVPKGPNAPKGYERYAQLAAEFEATDGVSIDALRDLGIILLSDPAGAVRKIEEMRQDVGQNQIMCWMRMGGLEHRKVMNSMKLFAKEVMPYFKSQELVIPKRLLAEVEMAALA